MNQQLREALEAIKRGDEEEARAILAELLRDEPENVPAWVLLSKLATSQVQKVAFLRRVLSLDPSHSYAREQLAASGAAQPQIPQPGEAAAPPIVGPGEPAETPAAPESARPGPEIAEEAEIELPTPEVEETADSEAPEPPAEEGRDLFPEEEGDLAPLADVPAVEPPPVVQTDDDVDVPELLEAEEREQVTAEEQEPETPAQVAAEPEEEEAREETGDIDWDRFLREEAGIALTEEEAEAELTMPVSEEPHDYDAQAEGDTLPPWMDQGETFVEEAPPVESREAEEWEEEAEEIPGWLREPPHDSWMAEADEEEEAATAEREARIAAAMAASPEQPAPAMQTSNVLLGILVVLAVLVFLALVYATIVLL